MQDSLKQKLALYKVPPKAVELIKNTRIVFLVGIAGAGKNTILNGLLKRPEYKFIVSHTTRPPRDNGGVLEQDGINYHFIDYKEAEDMLDNQKFIEAKNVHGKLYGTSVEAIESIQKSGKIAITDLDIQGVAEYMAVSPGVVTIFLLPPDFETWQKRLRNRYEDSQPDPDDIKRRMNTAKIELQEALDKDYFEFVINDDLERTVQAVDDIVHGSLSSKKNEAARRLAKSLLDKL
jgi:guanylate kinase